MNTFKRKSLLGAVMAGLACLACSVMASGPPVDVQDPAPAVVRVDRAVDNPVAVPAAMLITDKLQHQCASPAENAREAAPRLVFALHFTNPTETGALLSLENTRTWQLAQNRKLTRMLDGRHEAVLAMDARDRLADRRT